jgi:hypothetical protein
MYPVLRARSLKYLASMLNWPNSFSYAVIPLQPYQEALSVNSVSLLQYMSLKSCIILGESAIHT